MARKEDLRITKTKAALSNAFFSMLEEMALEDITVNDLCDRAGVRRATFYKHFSDKSNFIYFLVKDVRDKFESDVWNKDEITPVTKEYYVKYAEAVIKYLLSRDDATKKIISSPFRPTFIEVFVQQNYEDTKKKLADSEKNGMILICSVDVVASMLVGGIARCIVKWFDSDNRCPIETLLGDISKIVERVLA